MRDQEGTLCGKHRRRTQLAGGESLQGGHGVIRRKNLVRRRVQIGAADSAGVNAYPDLA
jgi:hypothetical protein